MTAVCVQRVNKKLNKQTEFGPLSLQVKQGTITALVGPNGIGKSTLLKMLVGLVKNDTGTIKVNGRTLAEDEVTLKRETIYVGQRLFGVEHYSTKQLAKLHRTFFPNWQEEKFLRYMQMLQVDMNKKIGKLSIGMQKRVALALALAKDSKLLLLDEPSASLDLDTQRWLVDELIAFMEEDETRSIVIASHVVSEIKQLADYVVIFDEELSLPTYEKDALLQEVKGIWLQERVDELPNVIVKKNGRLLIARKYEETVAELKTRNIEPAMIETLELEEIFTYLKQFNKKNEYERGGERNGTKYSTCNEKVW